MVTTAVIYGPFPLALLSLLLVSWQAAAHSLQKTPEMSPPSYEELSTSLVVNQLAILQLLSHSSNASCATVEMRKGSDADRVEAEGLEEALGAHVDRVLETLEARQHQQMQQMFGVLNNTALNTVARLEELREEMKEELAKIVPEEPATEKPTEDKKAVVQDDASLGSIILHNDTFPSMCSGNKYLNGTLGSLEVVKSGSYSSGVQCNWSLSFPVGAIVNLEWEYIDTEDSPTCRYDWVLVEDVTRSKLVYGKKLCGSLNSSIRKHLNVRLFGTRNLKVSFRADGSNEGRGFRMLYYPN